MGVKITNILNIEEIDVKTLSDKSLAIDSSLFLYQFLTTIRQRDGTLLTDSKGNVTSHLIGLLSRCAWMVSKGIDPVFVFDGKPPELKKKELEKRKKAKIEAKKAFETAKQEENIEDMAKFGRRMIKIDKAMVKESKELLNAMGIATIQAPSEGEAQAAKIAQDGNVWAVASQDADAILFGAPRLLRNLSSTQRKKTFNKLGTKKNKIEIIETSKSLQNLCLDREKLIAKSLLVGTDYNPGGIPGIGSKKALKLIKESKDLEHAFRMAEWDKHNIIGWKELLKMFNNPEVDENYTINKPKIDKEKIMDILVRKHDFSEERVNNALDKMKPKEQKGLGAWIGK